MKTLAPLLVCAALAGACSDTTTVVTCDAAHDATAMEAAAPDVAMEAAAPDVAMEAAAPDVAMEAAAPDAAMEAAAPDAAMEAATPDAAEAGRPDVPTTPPPRCPACEGIGCAIVEVTTGSRYSCARRASGEVLCWGDNSLGQLGDGTTTASSRPVSVLGVCDAMEVEAGSGTACARKRSGQVVCWGWNGSGELGAGYTPAELMRSPYPLNAFGLEDAISIEGGAGFFCAIRRSGQVVCWGTNGGRAIGDGTSVPRVFSPTAVSNLPDAVNIAASQYGCAARVSGQAVCWGNNFMGRLGNGGSANHPTPAPMVGISDAITVAAGVFHTCVTRASGAVACAGDNAFSELGTMAGPTPSNSPVDVPGVSTATDVTVGYRHACALLRDGTATCWGQNLVGELGRGMTSPSALAGAVPGLTEIVQITSHAPNDGPVEGSHTCALRRNGEVFCWGKNDLGQLGDGSMTNRPSPTRVTF